MSVDDVLIKNENSVYEYLQSVIEVSDSLPEIETSTKLLTALSKSNPEGGELISGLRVADEARTSLIAALKREVREGGNISLGVDSASNVGEAGEGLATAIDILRKSFQAAEPGRVKYTGEIEVIWRTGTLAARSIRKTATTHSYTQKNKTDSVKQKRLCAVLAFDANMARATAGFARMLAASRSIKQTDNDPIAPLKTASNELRLAAGCWHRIDDARLESVSSEIFDGGPPPPELSSPIACALREICLAAADRMALLILFRKEGSPPTTLPARLAAGIAQREQRALDFLRTFSSSEKQQIVIKPQITAMNTLSQTMVAGLTEGLWARALLASTPENVGRAVGCCRHGVAMITKAVAQIDRRSPIFKTPLVDTAKNLATAIGRRLEVYERDNNTIYFQAVPTEPAAGRETPLNLAKAIFSDEDSTLYELASDRAITQEEVPPTEAPPDYDKVAATPQHDYDAIRVTLPVGYAPGDRLVVEGPDKTRLETIVPAGARAGDAIEVNRSGIAQAPERPPPPIHTAAHMPTVASTPVPAFSDLSISSYGNTSPQEAPPPYSSSFSSPPQQQQPFISCPRCTFNNKPSATQCEM